jgi:hypothetical protein
MVTVRIGQSFKNVPLPDAFVVCLPGDFAENRAPIPVDTRMFNLIQKWRERRKANEAKEDLASSITKDGGNFLEMALMIHVAEDNKESFARLLIVLASSDVYTLNNGGARLADSALCEGPDGRTYVVTYSSGERSEAAARSSAPFSRASAVSSLELIFSVGATAGFVINPEDERFRWVCEPDQLAGIQSVIEQSFDVREGGIYTLWQSGGYRAVKVLKSDDVGVHVRLYANRWNDRPSELDPKVLSLTSEDESIKSIGHLPFTRRSFLTMGPRPVAEADVEESELDGYKIWAEAKGGYFS